MTMYTFCINGVNKTVEADNEEDAIKEARIKEGDAYDLIEAESFYDNCFLSAMSDENFLGSWGSIGRRA